MRQFLAALLILVSTIVPAWANLKVVASIKPVHALVAMVMGNTGQPGLIVSGGNSLHTYSLKPSDAQAIQSADVVFWVGPGLENFLEKPLQSLAGNATQISLLAEEGVHTFPIRSGNGFSADSDETHAANDVDGHIWLDPENAKAMLHAIAATLSAKDVANATAYAANAEAARRSIDRLSETLAKILAPLRSQDFIVFHDAYQYFEKRFNLQSAGSIALNPENAPGAATLLAIRNRIQENQIKCVFAEPQFDHELVDLVLEGSSAKSAVLDPEGALLDPGAPLYLDMMQNMANNLATCLGPP